MNKKSLFVVLFAMLCLAVFTVSVSADQDGHTNWCNMDQYGCWVTGDDGAQNYIMFWSEEARTYFMGPNSNAVVTDYCADCNGKLSLSNSDTIQYRSKSGKNGKEQQSKESESSTNKSLIQEYSDIYVKNRKLYNESQSKEFNEESTRNSVQNRAANMSEEELKNKLQEEMDYYNTYFNRQ